MSIPIAPDRRRGGDFKRGRTSDFHALRSKQRGQEAMLCAFDLIELNGDDFRDQADRTQAPDWPS